MCVSTNWQNSAFLVCPYGVLLRDYRLAAQLSTGRVKNLGSKRGAQEHCSPRLRSKRVLLVSPGAGAWQIGTGVYNWGIIGI
jgi:hypothetical protein